MNNNDLLINYHCLPESLPIDETCKLITDAQNGDEKALDRLVRCNLRLVLYSIRKRFSTVECEKEELMSIGTYGLIKAIKTFDITRPYTLSTYAKRCIDNEILMFLRQLNKQTKLNPISFNSELYGFNDDDPLTLEEYIGEKENHYEDYEKEITYSAIKDALENLSDREKKMVMLYFGFNNDTLYSTIAIAKMYNLSRSMVSRVINDAIKKIAYELQNKEIIEIRTDKKKLKKTNCNSKSIDNKC